MTQRPDSYHGATTAGQERVQTPPAPTEQEHLGMLSLEISIALSGKETLDDMLTACTDTLVHHLDAALARIWLLRETDNMLELRASSGHVQPDAEHTSIPGWLPDDIDTSETTHTAIQHKPRLVNIITSHPDTTRNGNNSNMQQWAQQEGIAAFAGYPLLVREQLVGVLEVFTRQPLSAIAAQTLSTVSNGIAMSVERQQMLEERTRFLVREHTAHIEAEQQLNMLYQSMQDLNASLEAQVAQRTEALNQTNLELQRSNNELQEFAYVASHDLQEPLRKIQAFGNLLEEEYGDVVGEGKMYIERMRSAAARMRILIDDLLAFSRVTSKAQPFVPVDLNAVAQQVVDDLEPRLEASHGTIELGSLPTIDADSQQMYQMLQNLLGNAVKFHRPDLPPLVKVSAEILPATSEDKVYCELRIEDNGIGFDEKYTDRIFTVFQRLHGKDAYEGTGIGLAVVRKIVERHNGTITTHSSPGKGTTFLVKLPIHHVMKEMDI